MRYYEYISDSKVDVLLPQVPAAIKQKVAAEIGTDFKIYSAKIKTEHATLEERAGRVRCVSEYIMTHEDVGPIAAHKGWVVGHLNVQYGFLGPNNEMVAFVGSMGATCFMLVGSSGHIVGAKPDGADSHFGYSFLPRMINKLQAADRVFETHFSLDGIRRGFAVFKKAMVARGSNETTSALKQEFVKSNEELLSTVAAGGARVANEHPSPNSFTVNGLSTSSRRPSPLMSIFCVPACPALRLEPGLHPPI